MMLRYLIIVLLILVSCNNQEKDKSTLNTHGIYKDTVIRLKDIETKGFTKDILTVKYAETVLYQYFKQKEGYITTPEMADHWSEIDNPDSKWKKEIGFVDVRYININNDGFKDAIVNYYNCEPYANGNCVMPHKAIICSARDGYKISNEEFLWPDFDIDSVTYLNSKPIIYGYRFDCGNQLKLQHYRVVLKE